jgi:hypothetical protein
VVGPIRRVRPGPHSRALLVLSLWCAPGAREGINVKQYEKVEDMDVYGRQAYARCRKSTGEWRSGGAVAPETREWLVGRVPIVTEADEVWWWGPKAERQNM